MDSVVDKVIGNLEKNNIKAYYTEKKEDVVPLVESILEKGMTVTVGGSKTLFECGVIAHLKSGRYQYLDRYEDGLSAFEIRNIFKKASFADAYLCSTNALTENGELYNVDGNSNRVCAIAYGPAEVIIITGVNKIVKDINDAVVRVKTMAAPLNAKRLNMDTYCAKNGKCISMNHEKKKYEQGAGCNSRDRICCNYLVSACQRKKDRIKVIIVGESLGF